MKIVWLRLKKKEKNTMKNRKKQEKMSKNCQKSAGLWNQTS